MKISTQTLSLAKAFGAEEAVKLICETGYDAIDFSLFGEYMKETLVDSDDFRKDMMEIRKVADSYGVPITQTHAPFPSYVIGNEKYNKRVFDLLVRAIEASSILGANQTIIHPIAVKENQKQFNVDFYQSLQPYAKKFNVKIALENMFGRDQETMKLIPNVCSTGEQFAEYLDALDRNYFVGCLDVGHCGIIGQNAADMIYTLGKDRLKALHIHDNDHVNDLHTLPMTLSIDFKSIMKALKDIGYEGDLTLEADNFLKGFPKDLLPEASMFMLKTAKQLIKMYEEA